MSDEKGFSGGKMYANCKVYYDVRTFRQTSGAWEGSAREEKLADSYNLAVVDLRREHFIKGDLPE